MLMAAKEAEGKVQSAMEKMNRHGGGGSGIDDNLGTAEEERDRRRAQRRRQRLSVDGDDVSDIEDWLAQAERERLCDMCAADEHSSRVGRTSYTGVGAEPAHDIGTSRRVSFEADLLFCPDARFDCFVRFTGRA